MPTTIESLQNALKEFTDSINKETGKINSCKNTLLQIQKDFCASGDFSKVQYIRDNNCLILSAPHIIIGDVDKFGCLNNRDSSVTIRGGIINTEATGSDKVPGKICNRATMIENIGVDPGLDGMENVVYEKSCITSQARAVTMQSNNEKEFFTQEADTTGGINIVSDTKINVSALAQNEKRKKALTEKNNELKAETKKLKTEADDCEGAMKAVFDAFKKLLDKKEDKDVDLNVSNYQGLQEGPARQFKALEELLYTVVAKYVTCLSRQAELTLNIQNIDNVKTNLENAAQKFKENTGTSINLESEAFDIRSKDGDDNYRTTATAKLSVKVPHIDLSGYDETAKGIEGSTIALNAQKVCVDTRTPTVANNVVTKRDCNGEFNVDSQKITFRGKDEEYGADGKKTKNDLNTGSKFNVQANKVRFKATDKDGKLMEGGSFTTRFKNTMLIAMEGTNKNPEPKKPATGSKLTLYAEKTAIGTNELENGQVELTAKIVRAEGGTNLTLCQPEGGAVKLADNKLQLTGDELTLDNPVTLKSKLKAEDIEANMITTNGLTVKYMVDMPNMKVGNMPVQPGANQPLKGEQADKKSHNEVENDLEKNLKEENDDPNEKKGKE